MNCCSRTSVCRKIKIGIRDVSVKIAQGRIKPRLDREITLDRSNRIGRTCGRNEIRDKTHGVEACKWYFQLQRVFSFSPANEPRPRFLIRTRNIFIGDEWTTRRNLVFVLRGETFFEGETRIRRRIADSLVNSWR